MGFSRQEHWSGLPCPPPEDFPDPGVGHTSLSISCTGRRIHYHLSYREVLISNAKYFQLFGDAIFIKTNRLIYSLNYTGRISEYI